MYAEEEEKKNKVLDFIMNPYESKIPKEMEAEIYRAEGNTLAAQERTKRITLYGILAIFLVGCAFFNGFLTELRHSDLMDGTTASMSLEELGFGWVKANFLFRFVFLNKIGGGLALLSGALSGMLAEAEVRLLCVALSAKKDCSFSFGDVVTVVGLAEKERRTDLGGARTSAK
jgi:hypothetical protein